MEQKNQDIVYIGFVSGHGGDAMQILDLAAGMAERGSRVKILVPKLPASLVLAERGAARGITVKRTSALRVASFRQNPLALAALIATQRGTLHFHSGSVYLPRMVGMVLKLLGVPQRRVLTTVHGTQPLEPGSPQAAVWSSFVETRIAMVCCPSEHSVAAQIRSGVPERFVRHIANGIDTKRFRAGDGTHIRSEFGVKEGAPLLTFSSRLDPVKRPIDALEGFIRISADYPDAHLLFAGEGELSDAIQARAREAGLSGRVHLAGNRNDVPDLLAATTIWMMPTSAENFSLSLLEALAAGCCILSTMCQGNDEVLVPGVNAEVHGIGDVDGLTAQLRLLLSDPARRDARSAAAVLTSARYDTQTMVDLYAACYREIGG